MATLYVTEYAQTAFGSGPIPIAKEPGNVAQTVAISGSSTQSSAFANNTYIIRVHTDSICSVLVGTNPTATTTSKRMAADQTEYFGVSPAMKIAVISNT